MRNARFSNAWKWFIAALVISALGFVAMPLSVHAQTASDTLRWTAPGDDGGVGAATAYDLRYSTQPITSASFLSATAWTPMPAPAVAGTQQSVIVTGLAYSATYYFAIKARDDAGNWSGISNVLVAVMPAPPDVTPPAPITDLH